MRDINDSMGGHQHSRIKLKQRVAGGAVLIIVLAIFLPFIFNHSRPAETTAVTPADNAPAAPQAPAASQPGEAAQSVAAPSSAEAAAPGPTAPDSAAPATLAAQSAPAADPSLRSDQPGLTPSQNEAAPADAQPTPQQPAPAAQPQQNQPPLEQSQSTPVNAPPVNAPAVSLPAPAVNARQTAPAAPVNTARALPPPVKTAAVAAPRGHWVVQVGSFSQAEYARQLAAKLRAKGLPAYTQLESNHMVHVYVGPLANQQQAQKIQQKIQSEFAVSGLVRETRA